VAITLGNLGNVLGDLGDLAGARERQEPALQIFQAAYGPDHPHTRTTQRSLEAFGP